MHANLVNNPRRACAARVTVLGLCFLHTTAFKSEKLARSRTTLRDPAYQLAVRVCVDVLLCTCTCTPWAQPPCVPTDPAYLCRSLPSAAGRSGCAIQCCYLLIPPVCKKLALSAGLYTLRRPVARRIVSSCGTMCCLINAFADGTEGLHFSASLQSARNWLCRQVYIHRIGQWPVE